MFNVKDLHKLERPQLVELAIKHGIKPHHKTKPETIIKQLVEAATKQKPQEMKHPAELTNTKEVKVNTVDEVEAVLKAVKERQKRFHVAYNDDGQTWHFMYKNDNGKTLREECGHLSVPLRIILQKANSVAQGPIFPRAMNEHFDSLNVSEKNGYTKNVLGA